MKTKSNNMAKKYNNKSNRFADWTTAKLKTEAKSYHSSIYEAECYGVKDIMILHRILQELAQRKITPSEKLVF